MKLNLRHCAATGLIFCPMLLPAQDLPSAPSAVAAQQGFQRAIDIAITSSPAISEKPVRHSGLTTEDKFKTFVAQSTSGYATFSSALAASFRPAWNNSQYSETYASRFGQSVSDQTEQGFFTKFLLPSVLHQDPRYHMSEDTDAKDRAGYALSRVFVTRNDNGRPTLNTSEILGAVLAASITTTYHPFHQPTAGDVASRAVSSIGADAGMNMLREFWPDIRGHIMDHSPKVVQTLVTRIGPRIQGTAAPVN